MNAAKICNKISRILTILCAVAALVFFFFGFASVTSAGSTITLTGAQMSFKGAIENAAGETVKIARSTDVWFCFWLTVLSTVFSFLTFKIKGMRYATSAFALGSGIYMLVIALSKPVYYVDIRPLTNVTGVSYLFGVWAITIALLAAAAFAITHLLLDDYITVKESKGTKYTISQRVCRFFKDYKSEVRKIVWPGLNSVVKNTLIVFAICAILGVFIWLLDFGLAKLLDLIFSL